MRKKQFLRKAVRKAQLKSTSGRRLQVLSDNERFLKTAEVKRLYRKNGAVLEYIPAKSPDLNPIEKFWSWVRSELQQRDTGSGRKLLTESPNPVTTKKRQGARPPRCRRGRTIVVNRTPHIPPETPPQANRRSFDVFLVLSLRGTPGLYIVVYSQNRGLIVPPNFNGSKCSPTPQTSPREAHRSVNRLSSAL